MGKLTGFLLLIIFCANAYSSDSKTMAGEIVDSLFMVDLSVDAALIKLDAELGEMPDKEYGLACYAKEFIPDMREFFIETLTSSLDDDALKQGVELSKKSGVKGSKDFILESDLAAEAESKNIRADVYMFYMASKQTDDSLAQQELVDVSKWVEKNGPLYSEAWLGRIQEYFSIIRGSAAGCFDFE